MKSERYPALSELLTAQGVGMSEIARLLRLRPEEVRAKFAGGSRFTLDEAVRLQEFYFPNRSLQSVFGR